MPEGLVTSVMTRFAAADWASSASTASDVRASASSGAPNAAMPLAALRRYNPPSPETDSTP